MAAKEYNEARKKVIHLIKNNFSNNTKRILAKDYYLLNL